MSIPQFMPVLSAGAHKSPAEGACVMEYVSMLAGEPFSDRPSCTHPVLARAAQTVNDRLPDDQRHLLVPLIGRLFGTAEGPGDKVLSVRLAAWSARHVLPLVVERHRSACLRAIEAAEAWADNPCQETAASADATAGAAYAAASNAAYATNATAGAAYAAAYAADAVAYAAHATNAVTNAAHAAGVDFLTGLIDEYDRLTGRTQHTETTTHQLNQLAQAVTQ